jgi:hypothetical protein
MKITHHTNSFLEIDTNGLKIVCDPWLYPANHGGWTLSPIIPKSSHARALNSADILYISHLHSDHLDEQLLSEYANNISANILIPHCENEHLYRKLRKILPQNNYILLNPGECFSPVDDLDIFIYPQQASSQSNKSADEDIFRYELDSSLLVIDRRLNISFFNQVDNPLSVENVFELDKFFRSISVDRLTCLCMAVGAASQYPQCFLGLNLEDAKNTLLVRLLDDFKAKLSILKPKVFFPAGGDYEIGGTYASLNKYKAIPSVDELDHAISSSIKCRFLDLRGGKCLDLSDFNYPSYFNAESNTSLPLEKKGEIVESSLATLPLGFREESIDKLFCKAQSSFESKLQNINFMANAACLPRYQFHLYSISPVIVEENHILSLDRRSIPSSKLLLDVLAVKAECDVNVIDYEFHIPELDFRSLLFKRYSWNQYVSGSNCMMRRSRNVHIAWHEMLLNFLVL